MTFLKINCQTQIMPKLVNLLQPLRFKSILWPCGMFLDKPFLSLFNFAYDI